MKLTAMNCPNCGAGYDPAKMRCQYCGSVIIISNENYVDLSANDLEPVPVEGQKYPGIYVFGRLLGKGEKPILLGEANLMKGLVASGGRLLLTNKSLSFSAHMLNIGKKEAVIKLEDITEVKLAANLVVSQHIVVKTRDESYRFVVFHGQEWVDKINEARSKTGWANAGSIQAEPRPSASGDYADELRKLRQLLDEGLITEDEYAVKKRQILGI